MHSPSPAPVWIGWRILHFFLPNLPWQWTLQCGGHSLPGDEIVRKLQVCRKRQPLVNFFLVRKLSLIWLLPELDKGRVVGALVGGQVLRTRGHVRVLWGPRPFFRLPIRAYSRVLVHNTWNINREHEWRVVNVLILQAKDFVYFESSNSRFRNTRAILLYLTNITVSLLIKMEV